MRTTWVTATAFIVKGDETLIVKRSEHDEYLPGYWEQAGGKLDWGESPKRGMAREVSEETGLEITPTKVYYAHHYTNEQKERYIVEIAYICEIVGSDAVTLSPEHSEYKWIIEDDLKSIEPISDEMRIIIQEGFRAI
ncbi:MAG: NUDIX domain-containing protein [Candidatus Andersenbacteria bacterium]